MGDKYNFFFSILYYLTEITINSHFVNAVNQWPVRKNHEKITVYAAYVHTSLQRNSKMLGLMDFQIPMRSNLLKYFVSSFLNLQTPGQSSAKRRKRESYEAGSSSSSSQNREVAENSTFVPFKYSEADYSTFSSKGLICFGIICRIGLTYKETSSCLGGFFYSVSQYCC